MVSYCLPRELELHYRREFILSLKNLFGEDEHFKFITSEPVYLDAFVNDDIRCTHWKLKLWIQFLKNKGVEIKEDEKC